MERGEARVFKRFKKTTRRRLTAVLMVMMMTVSLFSSVGIASAEPVTDYSYTVDIRFYDFNQNELIEPNITPVYNFGDMYPNYHVVVTLQDKETGEVAGYGFAVIDDINHATQTVCITEFWTTEETGDETNPSPAWKPLEEYDPSRYNASVRLYYGSTPNIVENQWNPGQILYNGTPYSRLITQQDTIDGYIFMSSSAGETSGEINLYKGTQEYAVRIVFDDGPTEITTKDGYYILVSAKHKSNGFFSDPYSYYYAPLVTDGVAETVDFIVKNGDGFLTNGDWVDQNGNPTAEKFTGNWTPVTVTILKAAPTAQPSLNNALQKSGIAETISVKDCSVTSLGVIKVRDEEKCLVENYDVIKLTKVKPTDDYNYLTVLGDAVNYGIVTDQITQPGHSETNFATKKFITSYNQNFDPDLSGNGTEQVPGNYLVGAISDPANSENENPIKFGDKTPATAVVFVGEDSEGKVHSDAPLGNVVIVPMAKDDINTAVDNMILHMKKVSETMAAKKATMTPDVIDNTLYLDTTCFEDGVTIYIDADAYNGDGKPISKNEGVHIKMKPNQTIVFNFKESINVALSKVVVDLGDGNGEHNTDTTYGEYGVDQNRYADKINQRLIWNCPKAETIVTNISGGVYLAPLDSATMLLGQTSTGWGVCAGEVVMGNNGEFHFVYQGLSKEQGVTLEAYKAVDGKAAGSDEKFTFIMEHYNSETGAFETVQTDVLDDLGNATGEKTDLVIENKADTIQIPVTVLCEGNNTFRITESGKAAGTEGVFTVDDKAIYAQLNVTINGTVMVPGPVNYYKSFANGSVSEKITEISDRTFHNTTVTTNNDDPNGNGTNDDPNGNGTNDNPNGNGTNDNPNGNGTNDNPNGNGTNDNPNGNGTSDNPNGNGTNDNPNGNGTNDNPNGNGTNDNPNGNGTNDNPNGNGTNDDPNGNGTNDDPNGNGTNDNPNGNGTNDNPNGNGTNDNPNGNGTNDDPNGNGTNDNPNGNGTNDDPNGNGTNDNPNGNGTNDNPNSNGTNDNPNGNGTNDNPNGNGTNDNPNGSGTNDNPNGNGTNDNANGNGTNDNANGNGTNDNTNGNGTNDNAGGNGTSDTTADNTTQNNVGDAAQNAAGEAAQSAAGVAGQSNASQATQNTAGGTGQNTTGETAQNTAGEAAQSGTGEAAQNPAVETAQAATGKTNTETGLISGQATVEKTNRDISEVTGEGSAKQTTKTVPEEKTETSAKTGDTITNSLIILMLLLSTLMIITVMIIKTDRVKERC